MNKEQEAKLNSSLLGNIVKKTKECSEICKGEGKDIFLNAHKKLAEIQQKATDSLKNVKGTVAKKFALYLSGNKDCYKKIINPMLVAEKKAVKESQDKGDAKKLTTNIKLISTSKKNIESYLDYVLDKIQNR